MGPAVADRLAGLFTQQARSARAFPQLTDRECDILELIARGQSNVEMARHLGLAPKTVRNLVSAVFVKLSVASRAEAIVKAREAGIGQR